MLTHWSYVFFALTHRHMPNKAQQACVYFFAGHKLFLRLAWWHHHMETISALLTLCAGNSPVTGEFPSQRPVMRSFDVFFDLRLNKRLSKQWWGWWFETLMRPWWRHCNEGCRYVFHLPGETEIWLPSRRVLSYLDIWQVSETTATNMKCCFETDEDVICIQPSASMASLRCAVPSILAQAIRAFCGTAGLT